MIPDLCVIDTALPGISGIEVCRILKSNPRNELIRIILMGAWEPESEEASAFNAGADDFVALPIRGEAFVCRIQALLRRQILPSHTLRSAHGVVLNQTQHSVTLDGVAVHLTPTEFRLLWAMLAKPGRTYSRHELASTAVFNSQADHRTVDVHIRSLREKLGHRRNLIRTVRGVGYSIRCD